MIFNIVVNEVVQAVLEELCIPQEAQHGMGWAAGERNIVFYVDDRRIASQDREWVQDALMVTVAMFRQMGMDKNLKKLRLWFVHLGSSGGIGGIWHISGRQ